MATAYEANTYLPAYPAFTRAWIGHEISCGRPFSATFCIFITCEVQLNKSFCLTQFLIIFDLSLQFNPACYITFIHEPIY